MLMALCCALALWPLSSTSEADEERRAARAFERNMVADEAQAARAQADYDRAQGQLQHQAAMSVRNKQGAESAYALVRRGPQLPRWSVGLRFGPYRPHVSGNKQVRDLYDLVFVSQSKTWFAGRPMQMGLQADFYPARQFGLLGVFGRVSYWRASGRTRLCLNAEQSAVQCTAASVLASVPGGDQAALSAVPLTLGVVWRYDGLRRLTAVPLEFSAKAGLDYHIWWASAGNMPSMVQGHKARGATLGYNLAIGASLGLEMFSKTTLSNRNSGVKSALFVEYQLMRGAALGGKDRAHRLDFTDNTLVVVGLTCDFL